MCSDAYADNITAGRAVVVEDTRVTKQVVMEMMDVPLDDDDDL